MASFRNIDCQIAAIHRLKTVIQYLHTISIEGGKMALPQNPVMTKFLSNKIESSHVEWHAYILEIANIFEMFDNEVYDRSLLSEMFETMSGRSAYAVRDASNFRDEFGAYGTYLGIFRLTNIAGTWRIRLTDAAKQFLCTAEPDVATFCALQMALFQYPNGAGCAMQPNGTMRVQANVRDDTKNEIRHKVRIVPFRLTCRIVMCMHEIRNISLEDVEISYSTLFMLFNDDSINQQFNPELFSISAAIDSYATIRKPDWVADKLTKFKRNFHIFEQTGLFVRTRTGLKVNPSNIATTYYQIKAIAAIEDHFPAFDPLYTHFEEHAFTDTIISQAWGTYYDGARLPLLTIQTIAGATILFDNTDADDATAIAGLEGANHLPVTATSFPAMSEYSYHERAQYAVAAAHIVDLQSSIVIREKANREHERMIHMINAHLLLSGSSPTSNVYIDLFAALNGNDYLFEVKTTTSTNYISQIRKGVSQLYEYRYRLHNPSARLCLVLQNKPRDGWIIDYLVNDRGINVCWLVDNIRFECPASCYDNIQDISLINREYDE